jgi:hypothetical protein
LVFSLYTPRDSVPTGNLELRYDNNVPFQIITNNATTGPNSPVHVTALYGSDAWTVSRRLTVNLGARYSHENASVVGQCLPARQFAPAQCFSSAQLPIFNSVSPRVHFAYDVSGTGKTALKGGFTRYYMMRGGDEPALADPASPTTTTWRWTDRNGDRQYQPGEVNLDPNGPDFVSISGGITMVINPDEKQEKTDEWSLSLERELMANFGIRGTVMYTRNFDQRRLLNILRPYAVYNIPIINPDPGIDGVVGNADDPGASVTYWDYPTSLRGLAFEQPTFIQDPNNEQTFKTFEVAVAKRMSSRWQLNASYSATKKDVPYLTNTGSGDFRPLTSYDPNAEINTAERFWQWQSKFSGAYTFPYEVMASANYTVESGTPWARQVLFRGGVSIPSIVLRVEPIGARTTPVVGVADFRLQKSFAIAGSQRIQMRLNIFNLLNASTSTGVNQRAGAQFGRTTSILPPRIVLFSIGYDF